MVYNNLWWLCMAWNNGVKWREINIWHTHTHTMHNSLAIDGDTDLGIGPMGGEMGRSRSAECLTALNSIADASVVTRVYRCEALRSAPSRFYPFIDSQQYLPYIQLKCPICGWIILCLPQRANKICTLRRDGDIFVCAWVDDLFFFFVFFVCVFIQTKNKRTWYQGHGQYTTRWRIYLIAFCFRINNVCFFFSFSFRLFVCCSFHGWLRIYIVLYIIYLTVYGFTNLALISIFDHHYNVHVYLIIWLRNYLLMIENKSLKEILEFCSADLVV